MKLYAISDLHLSRSANSQALLELEPHPDDWLLLAGDVSHSLKQFRAAIAFLSTRFGRVFWTPGNHDLWTLSEDGAAPRGVAKYETLVSICQEYGVLTPEDPFVIWPDPDAPHVIAPTFTLYDYSFRPDHVAAEDAIAWAAASGISCMDELVLYPDPFPGREVWCTARCRYTEKRLAEAAEHAPLIILNHYPLRREHARLWRIPRFSIWCGTHLTEEWHRLFPVHAVVYGHLHIRGKRRMDGVRFEEVSLGYPHQWQQDRGIKGYLRQILPEVTPDK